MKNMTQYQEILTKVSNDNNIPITIVQNVYQTYWYIIRNIVQSLPLKEDITEEEFVKLKPNINITRLGKLYVLYPKYLKLKKKYQLLQKQIKDN